MNSKRKVLLVGVSVIGVILLMTVGRRAQGSGIIPIAATARVQIKPVKQNLPFFAKRRDVRHGQVLDLSVLSRRFSLSDVESSELSGAMLSLGSDWIEQKGTKAAATLRDSRTLIIQVPALKLTEDQVESAVLTKLSKAVGVGKASAIWADPDGRQTLLRGLGWDRVMADATYTFTKTRDEQDVLHNGSFGYATFDVTYSYDGENPAGLGPSSWLGFTYVNTTNVGLGWNALAKAPTGYFRSEPLLGIESRPEPMPFVYYEKGSGRAELVSGLYPGSREILKVP